MDLLQEIATEAAAQKTAAATIGEIVALVQEAKDLEETLESLQEAYKSQSGRYNRIKQYELPKMLKEAGLKEFTLEDGSVKAKKEMYVSGSLPKEEHDKVMALEYLASLPQGDSLIKNHLSVDFSKGEDNMAKTIYTMVADAMKEMGLDVEQLQLNETVHAMSLQSFVKNMIKGGHNIDPEKLGCATGDVAKFEFFDADGKKKKKRTELK